MDNLSLFDQIKTIYAFLTAKKPEWETLFLKERVQLLRHTTKLFMILLIFAYIFSGKVFLNSFVIVVAGALLLVFIHDKVPVIRKAFALIIVLGITWLRYFLIGPETMLYAQVQATLIPMAVFLLTDSYITSCAALIYVFIFGKVNSGYILREHVTSPLDFEKSLEYFMDHYFVLNILMWGYISLVVYQKQALLAQLWLRQKEKEDLLLVVQKKNEELEKLSRKRTKFLLGLSHEFRNPINAALGNLELVNEKTTDPITLKYLVNCKVSIEMLFHLVSNLLDSTKLEAGILELNPLRKDSKVVFHKVWGIVKNLLDKQNLIGEFYIHKKIPRMLKIDSHFVIQILLNLILNAIKYTQEGAVMTVVSWIDEDDRSDELLQPSGVFHSKFLATYVRKKKVQVNEALPLRASRSHGPIQGTFTDLDFNDDNDIPLEKEEKFNQELMDYTTTHYPTMQLIGLFHNTSQHYEKLTNAQETPNKSNETRRPPEDRRIKKKGFLKMEVYDSGCGIDNDIIKHNIFEKFSSISPEAEDRLGLGLGLWLTKNLCEAIGGQVKAFSEKDKGSQFIAIVPAEPSYTLQTQEDGSVLPLQLPTTKLTALVVDDDKYNREINSVFLTRAGVMVKAEAVNGQEAVEIFTSKPVNYFDFILMDLEMPVLNGKEAVKKIRQFEVQQGRMPVKVIIATGNCDLAEYSACMDTNGGIRADFFYRKPLIKKDFEEFVALLHKDKAKQKICLIVKGDPLIVGFLQTFLKRHKVHLIAVDSEEEAENILKESRVNLRWLLLNLEMSEEAIKSILSLVSHSLSEPRMINVVGFCDGLTAQERLYFEKLGIPRILCSPLERDEINVAFNIIE